jgi:hypothetical protein
MREALFCRKDLDKQMEDFVFAGSAIKRKMAEALECNFYSG